jgi:hypothetical protein
MSQDASVQENRTSGLRPGSAYHRRRGLDAAWLCWHHQGNLVGRACELLDHYQRQYLGVDTPARRHHRSRGRIRRLVESGLGATAGDLHRHHLGVSELQVHPVRAPAGLNDHLHRPAGGPLCRLSDFAVHETRRAFVSNCHDLGANQRLSKRSSMTGRIFDEIERRF